MSYFSLGLHGESRTITEGSLGSREQQAAGKIVGDPFIGTHNSSSFAAGSDYVHAFALAHSATLAIGPLVAIHRQDKKLFSASWF